MSANHPRDNMKKIVENGLVLEHTVVDYDDSVIAEYRQSYYEKHGKIFSQTALASLLKLHDASVVSRIERGEMGMDSRTFSVFLLLIGQHPKYELVLKPDVNKSDAKLIIPSPDSAAKITEARHNIEELSQRNLSLLIGLHENMINKYESSSATNKNRRAPSPHTWTMLLLATKQHPFYALKLKNKKTALK